MLATGRLYVSAPAFLNCQRGQRLVKHGLSAGAINLGPVVRRKAPSCTAQAAAATSSSVKVLIQGRHVQVTESIDAYVVSVLAVSDVYYPAPIHWLWADIARAAHFSVSSPLVPQVSVRLLPHCSIQDDAVISQRQLFWIHRSSSVCTRASAANSLTS